MAETQEAPLANADEARTQTGEIKDATQETKPDTSIPEPKKSEETKPPETKAKEPDTKEAPKDDKDKSLLNKKEPAKPEGAPEKYEDFKLPEGYELDKASAEKATAAFKNMGLSQAQAQDLINLYAETSLEAEQAPYKAYADMREGWRNELKADPDIGSKLPQVKEAIGRAFNAINDPALEKSFREVMDLTGAGDHPAFAKMFYKLAEAYTEGRHVAGKGPSAASQKKPGQGEPTAAQALYPDLPSSQPQRG